jgi:lipopolysaccharide/colanic/teichoic acid biosynthesis glycosyltransferase
MSLQKNNVSLFKKRVFDLLFALLGILILWPLILIGWCLSCYSTKSNGFFVQRRIGRNCQVIKVIKLKTMIDVDSEVSSISLLEKARITKVGQFLRDTKLDELPQLINILLGHMSFVGPRPDVPGFADRLVGEDRLLLSVRPGITGPAALKYRNEEQLLASQDEPERYNEEVIWPDKVRINLDYIHNWSLAKDIGYIWQTIFR